MQNIWQNNEIKKKLLLFSPLGADLKLRKAIRGGRRAGAAHGFEGFFWVFLRLIFKKLFFRTNLLGLILDF